MMARAKVGLQLAGRYVWTVLLVLYPFADQIIATIEGWLPALAPHLGANTFRYVGLAIVSVKVGLQVYRGWLQVEALLTKKAGGS
jgi:hypothetical protein